MSKAGYREGREGGDQWHVIERGGRGSMARYREGRGSMARYREGRGSMAHYREGRGSMARYGEGGRGSMARYREGREGGDQWHVIERGGREGINGTL